MVQSAVKELVENSIDANATSICVTIVEGGLKELTVTDNGKGIAKEDFPLVCERFATSKIRSYEDLLTIGSFGFRGEALASLSYVSQVTVVSKERSANLAYSANFIEGKMVSKPQPHHLSVGTVITARNMFGTCLKARKESLKAAEQRRRIIRVVSQFAVHYNSVKFRVVCDGRVELVTEQASRLIVFGKLFEHRSDDIFQAETKLSESASLTGIFTKPKAASAKSKSLMLVVNNRIVELPDIFSAVDDAYVNCFKSIHMEDITFMVYLSLSIDPQLIDCNVHPTKKIVQIVNSSDLCGRISKWVLEVLKAECKIMSFYEQQKIPVRVVIDQSKKDKESVSDPTKLPARARTDSKQIPMRYYLKEPTIKEQLPQKNEGFKEERLDQAQREQTRTPSFEKDTSLITNNIGQPKDEPQPIERRPPYEHIDLRCGIDSPSAEVKDFFRNITYVGCVNSNFILVQHQETLRLLNVLPFMPALLVAWLKKEPTLFIKPLKQPVSVSNLLSAFSQKSKIGFDKEGFGLVLVKQRHLVWKLLKISISQAGYVTHTCYPLQTIEHIPRESEIGYVLARSAKHILQLKDDSLPDEALLHSYLVYFLSSLFEEPFTNYVAASAQQYDSWYRNKLLPLAKLKADFTPVDLSESSLEMLHLKQVYKVFERC